MLNKGSKGKVWPMSCQDCGHNKKADALCSLIREPVPRTIDALRKYAVALQYLAKLKNPDVKIDVVDLMFKAFELTGAYQHLLNEQLRNANYLGQNPLFMADVAEKLKVDFRKNEDFIFSAIEAAKQRKKVVRFFKRGSDLGSYDDLAKDAREKQKPIEPFTDEREIGLKWAEDVIDFELEKK